MLNSTPNIDARKSVDSNLNVDLSNQTNYWQFVAHSLKQILSKEIQKLKIDE